MPRTIYFSSGDDVDFALSGAEGAETSVPGLTKESLEQDLRAVQEALARDRVAHAQRLRDASGTAPAR